MNTRKQLLLASAARLYSLGLEVERARGRLRELTERGVPFHAPEMLGALRDFRALDAQWKDLERQHLELRGALPDRTGGGEKP